jgi:hypothetical protein
MFLTRNEKAKCVMARIRRRNQLYQENFTLTQYGSWEKAEAAARKWVKATLPELPDTIPVKGRMSSRNTSGIVGVRLAESIRLKNGNEYRHWRWIAFWPECPFPGGIGWSVDKYGENEAFLYAAISRKLETVDRDRISVEYLKLKGTKEFKRLLSHKRIELA